MSLWWAKREQLDKHQVELIEDLPLHGNHLVLGPPGSGKTNILLRRAQFVRLQQMPNIMVLTYTRALTEFLKTGCADAEGREIFPRSLISTMESWIRRLYTLHDTELPPDQDNQSLRKAALAAGALKFAQRNRIPTYDCLFVDEAQDLMTEEIALLESFSSNLFFVGDDRQKIYSYKGGLDAIRALKAKPMEHTLPFHYRLVEEICQMADRIQTTHNGKSLASTCHYDGPRPGRIQAHGPLTKAEQMNSAVLRLRDQIRVYADFIQQGDRIGVIVPRTADRELVMSYFERDSAMSGKSQIIRARSGEASDRNYNPTFDPNRPISIMTVQACKGLEFRAVHWLFCEELSSVFHSEHYYTAITRTKTSLDMYYSSTLPQELARAYSPPAKSIW
jgi:superfamily I DNA/RNA helicase